MILRLRGHQLHLFEFSPTNSEIGCHPDNLARADKVFWIGAKLFQAGSKLAARHSFSQIETDRAGAGLCVVQAEFANCHLDFKSFASRPHRRR